MPIAPRLDLRGFGNTAVQSVTNPANRQPASAIRKQASQTASEAAGLNRKKKARQKAVLTAGDKATALAGALPLHKDVQPFVPLIIKQLTGGL